MLYVFGLDDGFAMPTGVAVRSLDRFLGPDDEIVLLHTGLTDANMERLGACVEVARHRFVEGSRQIDPSWVAPGWLSPAAFLRYLAADVLADAGRCVYLDGDVVVRRSPSDLAETDLCGKTVGAIRSRVAPFLGSPGGVRRWFELQLPSAAPYFNSGVLVIDLERWRATEITDRLTTFLRTYGHDTWIADQEAMNAVLAGDWLELDRTWNYITHVSESFLQNPELEPRDPHIVHFAGREKPWSHGVMPLYAEAWYEILGLTPWCGFRPAAPDPPRGVKAAARRVVRRSVVPLRRWVNEP
jgi:lipopolysaccharide biosynthesis glycosyltransferase